MADAEHVRDDDNVVAFGDVPADPVLGEAIEQKDHNGEEQETRPAVASGFGHCVFSE